MKKHIQGKIWKPSKHETSVCSGCITLSAYQCVSPASQLIKHHCAKVLLEFHYRGMMFSQLFAMKLNSVSGPLPPQKSG